MVQRISEFDLWKGGYGASSVEIIVAGTTTLANVYTDEALTIPADNPQKLDAMNAPDGTRYGKFEFPLYTAQTYTLAIDGIENTGVQRANISDLAGEDASEATLKVVGSNFDLSLQKFAGLSVNVASYGVLVEGSSGVLATNTATIALAIASLTNGGQAVMPSGVYRVNSLDIPQGVLISGQGREATTLQSNLGGVSFSLVGNRSGFRHITLDGDTLLTNSIGVKSVGNDEVVFDDVMIRRFETGIHFLGGKGHVWNDFSIENTETGAKLHGDTDAGDTGNGGKFEDLIWNGGLISVATTTGLSLSYEDEVCHNLNFNSVGFVSCSGVALDINGAQSLIFNGCFMEFNVKAINIDDDDDALTPPTSANNDVINVEFNHGRMNGGEVEVTKTCQNVRFKNVKIEDVDFTLTTPLSNYLILEDCFEDSNVTIGGETEKLIRVNTGNNGASFGLTTTATPTKAWSISLLPGQMAYLVAKVIAKGRNVSQRAVYHVGSGVYRAGATLAYDTQTANFTAGQIITGATSGATARVQSDTDGGAQGTLTLTDIQGEFIDNEIITDNNGTPGSATVNGSLAYTDAQLDTVGTHALRPVYETNANWNAAFVANGPEIELRVTGAASQTVEWTVDMEVITT